MAAPVIEAWQIRKLKPQVLTDWSFEDFSGGRYNGSFRENINSFLQECGESQAYRVSNMPVWYTKIKGPEGLDFPLYTIQETVKQSPKPFCNHCKFTGWGHHYVSKRRYHFIVPERDHWHQRLEDDFFENRTHVLYGLIHCNGYGHLICINGVKEDSYFPVKDESEFPCEDEAMNLWDCICSLLLPRAISVRDVMDLKLLYVLTCGQSWYSDWGYQFRHGSFGLTMDKYEEAVVLLSRLALDRIAMDFKHKGSQGTQMKQIIYKNRRVSTIPLITISDLFQFILGLEARVTMNIDSLVTSLARRSEWHEGNIRNLLNVIVSILKKNKAKDGRIDRQELENEAIRYDIDSRLIDFVLGKISCFRMGNHVIRGSTNSLTKVQEFKIHEASQRLNSFPFVYLLPDHKWPEGKVNHLAEVIFNILSTNHGTANALSWEELHKIARDRIDDNPDLIEFVISSIHEFMFGNQVVARSADLFTKVVQFSVKNIVKPDCIGNTVLGENLDEDVLYFYSAMVFGYNGTDSVSLAIWDVLNSRHFVKEWPLEKLQVNPYITVSFKVLAGLDDALTDLNRRSSPGEVVFLPSNSSIGELKSFVQHELRDTYCIMERFQVERLVGLEGIRDCTKLSDILNPGETMDVLVEGSELDFGTSLRYEDGPERSNVKCICGTKYEDGERMATCYRCLEMHHTRCCGIEDNAGVPLAFACPKCKLFLSGMTKQDGDAEEKQVTKPQKNERKKRRKRLTG